MSIAIKPWVVPHVRDLFIAHESSESSFPNPERECAIRLVNDLRMKEVFESKYLNRRLTEQGWRIWFDIAKGILPADLKDERDRLKLHTELVRDLAVRLQDVEGLLNQLSELDAGELNKPRELYNPLVLIDTAVEHVSEQRNSHLPFLFESHVKSSLDSLRRFSIGRYIPSVPQIISALSDTVSNYSFDLETLGAHSGHSEIDSALAKRQHAPLTEYVRCFDDAIKKYPWDIGGENFLMPAETMAIQVAVALDIEIVDEKQIRNAREGGARKK